MTSPEKTDYVSVVNKFLRYKSDNAFSGWYINDFILLFQRKDSNPFENGWYNSPIYVMEIELYDKDLTLEQAQHLPCVHLSKFEYNDIESWLEGCSPTNHWRFYYPLRNKDVMNITIDDNDLLTATVRNKAIADKDYWGLKTIKSKKVRLMEINADNVIEKVFNTFDSL